MRIHICLIIVSFLLVSCKDGDKSPETTPPNSEMTSRKKDSVPPEAAVDSTSLQEEEQFELTEENAIDFFHEYQQDLEANRVKMKTSLGDFTIELYDNVPYHKANFIYLARQQYFDSTMFHRVVKDFIIQGGNADNLKTAKKRSEIGRYLLPPDTRKGHKHHRGTISMPSSEINNPHMLASPYEFFIVVTDPGSYHLDGEYTPFGRVVEGMDVVDKINNQPVDAGDWPKRNIYILEAKVLE